MAPMRALVGLLALTTLIGCGSGGTKNAAQPATPEPAANRAEAPAAPGGSAELSAAWLAGRWQAEGPDQCGAGDTKLNFEPDGRYAFMEEQGRWSLEGDRLTIEVTQASSDSGTGAGERNTSIVRAIGPNEAEFQSEGQPAIRVYRCPNESPAGAPGNSPAN